MRTWLLTFIAGFLLIAPPAKAADQVVFTSDRTGKADLFVMAPNGSGQTNITNSPNEIEEYPMWNLDGTKIAFTKANDPSSSPRNKIFTINPDGTGLVATTIDSDPIMPSYMPNSTRISYSRNMSGDKDVYTSNPDGTNQTRLTNNTYGDYYARWNPSGTKFVYYGFVSSDVRIQDIIIANADGTGQVRLTANAGQNHYATWKPDGSKLVFMSNRNGSYEIYSMNPDGTSQTRLTSNSADDTVPVYSPDGTKIMFVSNRDGNNEIYVMNADGTNQTRITNNPANENFPTWVSVLDANAPTISVNDISATEGVANNHVYNFTATLSAPSTTPVTLSYETYDISAVAGSDYVATPLTQVTFAPGQTTKSLPVTVIGDRLNEINETFGIRLAASGARLAKYDAIATIPNDDPIPTIRVANLTVPEGQKSDYILVQVTLSAPSGQPITGTYAVSPGTATAGSDYEGFSGNFLINPGETTGRIPVYVLGDLVQESDETLFVSISNVTNATIGTARGTVTLTDDDKFPYINISDTIAAEGSNAIFTVTLSRTSTTGVQVKYTTSNDTAVAGSDYSTRTGTLNIAAGQTSGVIAVPILTDSVIESNEKFTITLSDPVNGTIIDGTGVGTITNTTAPTVYVSDVTIKEGNSSPRWLYFTIALSDPIDFPVTVTYATEDGTATAGSDYYAVNGTVTFTAGQTSQSVVVPIYGDTTFESDETFLLNVTATANGATSSTNGLATIVNDDASAAKSTGSSVSGQGY